MPGGDLLQAVLLALVLEGLLYAAFPAMMHKMLSMALERSEQDFRKAGLLVAVVGVGLLYVLKR